MSVTAQDIEAMIKTGRLVEAETAIDAFPDPFFATVLRGGLLMRRGEWGAAMPSLDAAVRMRPYDSNMHYNRSLALRRLGRWPEAAEALARAVQHNFSHLLAWRDLAHVHLILDNWAESLACYERCITMAPEDPASRKGLACWLQLHEEDEAAEREYRTALYLARGPGWELEPDDSIESEAETALGFVELRQGKWSDGWKHFEARWRTHPFDAKWDYQPKQPWRGTIEDFNGKTVLLGAEQGFGDTIQFCRYASLVADRAKTVYLTAPPAIRRLLSTFDPRIVTDEANAKEPDIIASLMSLPRAFGTTDKNAPPPALFEIPTRDIGRRIGVCWHGGARPHDPLANDDDQRRSIIPELFWPVIETADRVGRREGFSGMHGVVSLQQEDLAHWGAQDWVDTAAIIGGLELVITVDTAIAHLAASLGVETWMLARFGGCWRWGTKGDRTFWYPTMRIYRQPFHGGWGVVVEQVVADLKAKYGGA